MITGYINSKLKECLLKTQAHENQNSSTEMIPSHQFCEWAKNSSARTRIILQTSRFELLVIDCTFHIVHPHKLVSYHECDFSRLQNTAKSFENNVQRARCRYKEDSMNKSHLWFNECQLSNIDDKKRRFLK